MSPTGQRFLWNSRAIEREQYFTGENQQGPQRLFGEEAIILSAVLLPVK